LTHCKSVSVSINKAIFVAFILGSYRFPVSLLRYNLWSWGIMEGAVHSCNGKPDAQPFGPEFAHWKNISVGTGFFYPTVPKTSAECEIEIV
jgi:hypothetical protein